MGSVYSHSSADRNADLQRALIAYYRDHHSSIPLSPIADDYGAPIVDFYVQPLVVSVDIQHRFLGKSPNKTPLTSYKQLLFLSKGTAHKNIYVTASPGNGKTAFCKRLCATWCQAHDPQKTLSDRFSAENIAALKHFKFVFYIPLREVDKSVCYVDDMIRDFINHRLPRTYTEQQVKDIQHKKRCLVILDGLDEWNHPIKCQHWQSSDDIPHRFHGNNNTILTTSRPWKFSAIRLTQAEIDGHIEIEELSEERSNELASKSIKFLNEKTGKSKATKDFFRLTSSLILKEIRHIPYIYTQSICLWFDDRDIGKSKCQVYSNILEVTLERAILKRSCTRPDRPESHKIHALLPPCFKGLYHCVQFYSLLSKVGKLAFSSLIKTESIQMLVMDVEFTREYLTQEELELCLKLGLLNQEKCYRAIASRKSNVSFNHKILHEFFAALYLYSAGASSEKEEVLVAVIQKCRSDILEMSNIFVILSGFDSNLYRELSQRTADKVMHDDTVRRYRQAHTSWLPNAGLNLALGYQKLQTECAREMELNRQEVPALPLQDIVLNADTKSEENLSLLQKITSGNDRNVKSLYISNCKSTEEVAHILQELKFTSLKCLQKLEIRSVVRKQDVNKLLMQSQTTLQTLHLTNICIKENIHVKCFRELSQKCEKRILNMSTLQVLYLKVFILEHVQIQRMAAFITSRNTMTGIGLGSIRCKDHNKSCGGVTLDLSQHENMVQLHLHSVPISQLDLNTQHLEECLIGKLATDVVSSWLSCLPTAQHLRRLGCTRFCDDTLPGLIAIMPALTQLERIQIRFTDLGDRRLVFSPVMTQLDLIHLWKVTLQSVVLQDLADTLINHSLSVTVSLEDCTVTPQEDFQALKENIETSEMEKNVQRIATNQSLKPSHLGQQETRPKFRVLEDGLDSNNGEKYIFQTIPEC